VLHLEKNYLGVFSAAQKTGLCGAEELPQSGKTPHLDPIRESKQEFCATKL
jgi:hypothetical protein